MVAGGTLARVGLLALQLEGSVAAGVTLSEAATLGIAWDPPMALRCPRPAPPTWLGAVAGSIAIGLDHTEAGSSDSDETVSGWGDRFLGEDNTPNDDTVDLVHVGARYRFDVGARAFIALAGGITLARDVDSIPPVSNNSASTVFTEAQVGVDLVHLGGLAVTASETIDVFWIGASAVFALGVDVR